MLLRSSALANLILEMILIATLHAVGGSRRAVDEMRNVQSMQPHREGLQGLPT
jgi:hypothetical protein